MGEFEISNLRGYAFNMPLRRSCSNCLLLTLELILFHCTFLALKADDSVNHTPATVDDELHGEKEYFGGYDHLLMFIGIPDAV